MYMYFEAVQCVGVECILNSLMLYKIIEGLNE
jgi:hypothetical protein